MKPLQEIAVKELYELFLEPVFEQRRRVKDDKPMVDRHGNPVMQHTGRREIPEAVAEGLNRFMYDDGVTGIVVYQNMMMDSSNLGTCTAVRYGPGCDWKTVGEAPPRIGDLPSRMQEAKFHHIKLPKRKVIYAHDPGGDIKTIFPNGHIGRSDPAMKPSGKWRITGAEEHDNFGHVVRVYTIDEVLRGIAGGWRFKNGKQRIFMRDLDYGTHRLWVNPPYDVG